MPGSFSGFSYPTTSFQEDSPGVLGQLDNQATYNFRGGLVREYDTELVDIAHPATGDWVSIDANKTLPSYMFINWRQQLTGFIGYPFSPSGAFTATAKFNMWPHTSGAQLNFGLMIGNSDLTVRTFMYIDCPSSPSMQTNYSYYSGGAWTQSGAVRPIPVTAPFYARITRGVSNDWNYYGSMDGVYWWRVTQFTLSMSVARVGFYLSSGNTTGFYAGVDWIRCSVP